MKIRFLAILLFFSICCFTAISKNDNDKIFSLDKKIAFKVNGENAQNLHKKISRFLDEKHLKIENRKSKEKSAKASKKKKSGSNFLKSNREEIIDEKLSLEQVKSNRVDTIYIYERGDIEGYRVDIHRHSIRISFSGAKMLDSAYNKLISCYVDIDEGGKSLSKFHAFISPIGYSSSVDLTKEELENIDLRDNIEWAIAHQHKTIEIVLYSPTGCALRIPEFNYFIGNDKLSSGKILSQQELLKILNIHSKKIKYIFVVDFTNDNASIFKNRFGYDALSDEGLRALSPFFENLSKFVNIGEFEIEYEGGELEINGYIKKLVAKIENKAGELTVRYRCKSK